MKIFEYEKLSVRTVSEEDVQLLYKWLSNPKLLQYYNGRDCKYDEQSIKKKFLNKEDNVVRCIVEFEEMPIGYIQFYPIKDEDRNKYGYFDKTEIIYGTDQFIGETSYWNQGIGTLLVKSMIRFLLEDKKADKIIMDPQCWNERAIACYEKCGFVKKKLLPAHEMHEGEQRDCWLIEYSS